MRNHSKPFVSPTLDFLFQSIHTLLDPVILCCLFVRPSRHGSMSSPSPFSSPLPVFSPLLTPSTARQPPHMLFSVYSCHILRCASISWIHVGDSVTPSIMFFSSVSMSWAYLGHILGISWAYHGHILGISRA